MCGCQASAEGWTLGCSMPKGGGSHLRALSSPRVVSVNSDLGIYWKRVMAATPPATLQGDLL